MTTDLPVTATRKVDKPELKRLQWTGPDPVFERTPDGYRPLTAERVAALRAEFEEHRRTGLLSG